MNKYNAFEEINKAIDIKIEERLKSLSFDYTVDGTIISNDGGGLYTVEINGVNYQIKTINNRHYRGILKSQITNTIP